jgi:hypothetical protein
MCVFSFNSSDCHAVLLNCSVWIRIRIRIRFFSESDSDSDPAKSFVFFRIRIRNTLKINGHDNQVFIRLVPNPNSNPHLARLCLNLHVICHKYTKGLCSNSKALNTYKLNMSIVFPGLRPDELLMIILRRIKHHTGEAGTLWSELRDLCGDKLEDVVEVIVNHRQSLLVEFQVWVLSNAD